MAINYPKPSLIKLSLLAFWMSSGVVAAVADIETSPAVLVLPGKPVTIWCSLGQDYESCKWTSSTGETCLLLHSEFGAPSTCMSGVLPTWSPSGKGNCSITISSATHENNGRWMCTLADLNQGSPQVGHVDVMVAKQAQVEFVDLYGTLYATVGKVQALSCMAKHTRPVGSFIWAIGKPTDENGITILTTNHPSRTDEDDQGFFTVTQDLEYTPDVSHDGKNLYCTYRQLDSDGKPLFDSSQDEVSLSIHFLEQPTQEVLQMPPGKLGSDYLLEVEFGAKPMPESRDVKWIITSADEVKELVLKEGSEAVLENHYMAPPLTDADGENRYTARLIIMSMAATDFQMDYQLQLAIRDHSSTSGDISSLATYRFTIPMDSGDPGQTNEVATEDGEDGENSKKTTTIVVVVVLVLILVITGLVVGLICYAKKNTVWCFKEKGQKAAEGETSRPLNSDGTNA